MPSLVASIVAAVYERVLGSLLRRWWGGGGGINDIRTEGDAVAWVRACAARGTDELVDVARAAVAREGVTEDTVARIRDLLKGVRDPCGQSAYALTVLYSVIVDHAAGQFILVAP